MINLYIILPIFVNIAGFFLLPIKFFILLTIVNSIYMVFCINSEKENIEISSIDYIAPIPLLMLIISLPNEIKYCIVPMVIMFISKIIIFNLNNKSKEIIEERPNNNVLENTKEQPNNNVLENTKEQPNNNVLKNTKEKLNNNVLENTKEQLNNNMIKKARDGSINLFNTKHIKNKDIRIKFIETFYDAEKEINIICPWISNWVKNDVELIDAFKFALYKGVNIKILYGIGNFDSNKVELVSDKRNIDTEKNAENLKDILTGYKGQLYLKKGNTHQKILICDDKYFMEGSYNLLSFKGDYNGNDTRDESMMYQENKTYIKTLRKEYFNF